MEKNIQLDLTVTTSQANEPIIPPLFILPEMVSDESVIIVNIQYFLSALHSMSEELCSIKISKHKDTSKILYYTNTAEKISGILLYALKRHSLTNELQITIVKALIHCLDKFILTHRDVKQLCGRLHKYAHEGYYYLPTCTEKDKLEPAITRLDGVFRSATSFEQKVNNKVIPDLSKLSISAEHYFSAWQKAKSQQDDQESNHCLALLKEVELLFVFGGCQTWLVQAMKHAQQENQPLEPFLAILDLIFKKALDVQTHVHVEIVEIWNWLSDLYIETSGISDTWSGFMLSQLMKLHEHSFNSTPLADTNLIRENLIGQYYQQQLISFREMLITNLLEFSESTQTILAKFNQAIYHLLQSIISFIETILGRKETSYCLLALGSLSRRAMTTYSDVELLLLVDNSDAIANPYLNNFIILLEFIMASIGEPEGFHLDATAKLFLRLYKTPEQIVNSYLVSSERTGEDSDDRLMMVCSLMHASYLAGNKELYNELQIKLLKRLTTNSYALAEQLAKEQMRLHVDESGYGDSSRLKIRKDKTLKTYYYRS